MASLQKKGEGKAMMMPYYVHIAHQSPQPFMCPSNNEWVITWVLSITWVSSIHFYLRSLRSKMATVDIIPVYCSNEARFRVQCAEQWARGKLWALSWRWTKGQTVGRGLIASCKVIPPPLAILSTVHCVAIYNKLEQLECVSVEYLWNLVTS